MRVSQVIGSVTLLVLLASEAALGQFTTVINVDNSQLFSTIPAGTQVNVLPGGVLTGGSNTTFITGGELNITGGKVDTLVDAEGDSRFNISIGDMLRQVRLLDTSGGTISGGSARNITTRDTSRLNVLGGATLGIFIHDASSVHLLGDANIGPVYVRESGRFMMDSGATDTLNLQQDATALISGGHIGGDIAIGHNSQLTLMGSEFRIDGVPVAGVPEPDGSLLWNVQYGSVLTGRLADGTAFGYRLATLVNSPPGKVQFQSVDPPAVQMQFDVPIDPVPHAIGAGQVLNLLDGGTLPEGFVASWGSEVNISGGQIGGNFKAYGAALNMSGGETGYTFEASLGSQVNMSGGTFRELRLSQGTQAKISNTSMQGLYVYENAQAELQDATLSELRVDRGGHVDLVGVRISGVTAAYFGTITIEGGLFDGPVNSNAQASITIAGGTYASVVRSYPGGELRFVGDMFAIDGVPVAGLDNEGDTVQVDIGNRPFTGILADGTPFLLGGYDIADGTLTLERRLLPKVDPEEIFLPGAALPKSVRSGQKLTVAAGAQLGDNFRSGDGAVVVIDGGSIWKQYQAIDTDITLRSGALGPNFSGYYGTRLEVKGGAVQQEATLNGSHLEMTGGVLGRHFRLRGGSTATIHGGQIGEYFGASSGSATIHGGVFGDNFSLGTIPAGPRGTEGEPEPIAFGTASVDVVDVYGGTFGRYAAVHADGHANIFGGEFVSSLAYLHGPALSIAGSANIHGGMFGPLGIASGATLTLYGTHFTLPPPTGDGPEIDLMSLLEPNVPYLLDARNTTLTATLADGSPFDLELSTMAIIGRDYVHSGARVYLVLVQVPEPATSALALVSLALMAMVHCKQRKPR